MAHMTKPLRHVRVPTRFECVSLDLINWLMLWRCRVQTHGRQDTA